ncbi:unnamed protein product [Rangifer tarandus platyrhynchus]|uniref:Uncharacterized protein n=2 Tax=Rangifer tarandus platyrhynchus TaxID=3082113 RepID=A0ACB0FNA5_RANTA|nr:unnamed protein product [Rangifer tarandus platyrhynchus]
MPVTGMRLSLCTAGVLQLLSATGSIFLASALQLTSEGKTFWRVAEELSWSEALGYCRRHHTDLADLHSMTGWSSIKALYSLTSSHEAWVGLFFDVRLGGLRWSSGSSFIASVWGSLPTFREGLCATLYSITFLPSLGAAWCTARRPFICYYDPTVGAHTLLEPVLSLTATPKPVEVQLGNLTFKRFDQEKMWLEALGYCRRYHTDLADLQTVTEEMDEDLKSITSNTEAWIGLYFSAASGSPRWSSDRGSSIPSWLQPPKFGAGLCAGLSRYWSFPSRISAVTCFALKPFICFDDPTMGHRDLAALPQLFHTPSSEVTVGMTPRPTVTSERRGTNMTDTAPATQAQHWNSANHPESKEKTPAPKPGQLFGILKADFLIPVLMNPEDMKDQFLSEIQDVLNLTLGHEQFRLKWVGFEVNKK